MTIRNITVGSASGTYYERLKQNGGNTPLAMRLQGKFLDLPYTSLRESRLQTKMELYSDPYEGRLISATKYALVPSFFSVSVSALTRPSEADVIAKLAGKWRQTDLNIGMYLSPEGRESAQMIGGSLLKLANATRSLKRGDFGGFCRNLNELPRSARRKSARAFDQGDLSGSFLAAHLGWEPLIKDIYNLSENVAPREKSQRIRASKRNPLRSVTIPAKWQAKGVKLDTKQKGSVAYLGDVSREPTFTQRFGLDNPFLIAWELVPLSFVADYFLPIGNTIDSLGFISQARFSKLWRKEYAELTYKVDCPRGVDLGNKTYFHGDAYLKSHYRSSSRQPHSLSFTDPFRSMNVKLPSSLMKLSTLSALVHQRILSLSKR